VFPARAGVIPSVSCVPSLRRCVPRASGGDPESDARDLVEALCSPRERG